jgi:hypothetical protein
VDVVDAGSRVDTRSGGRSCAGVRSRCTSPLVLSPAYYARGSSCPQCGRGAASGHRLVSGCKLVLHRAASPKSHLGLQAASPVPRSGHAGTTVEVRPRRACQRPPNHRLAARCQYPAANRQHLPRIGSILSTIRQRGSVGHGLDLSRRLSAQQPSPSAPGYQDTNRSRATPYGAA